MIKAIPPVLAHTANGPFNSPDHLFETRMLELLDGLNGNGVIDSPAVEGCGQEMIKLVKARCLEGVMAKRMDGRYLPGRRAPVHSCPNITANAGRSAAKVSNSLSSVEFGESVALGGILGEGGSDGTLLAMVDRLYHVDSIHEVRPPQLPAGLDDRPDLLLLQHTARSVRQNRAAAEPNKLLSVLVR